MPEIDRLNETVGISLPELRAMTVNSEKYGLRRVEEFKAVSRRATAKMRHNLYESTGILTKMDGKGRIALATSRENTAGRIY